MGDFADLLDAHCSELVERWYQRWKIEGPARPDLSEAVLKDHLPVQLRAIADAMRDGDLSSKSARDLWKRIERLDPEARVRDDVPIEEVVREYGFVLDEVRGWLQEAGERVSVEQHSFFVTALFELAAESARRYATYQAEQVARSRSEYLAGIAHQLRTPVTTLKLYVQRLERGTLSAEPATTERLRRTVARLSRLVDGILRLERFKPEEIPVYPERIAPAEVIRQLVADYAHDADRKGLRLDTSVDPWLRIEADPDLLVDALGNLIQNAVKFTERGFVRVSAQDGKDDLVFRVEDSGPGMSAERQASLFQPVQPGKPGGAGLGLTIAHRAALAQGGSLEVESEEGRGTTFLYRVPKKVTSRTASTEDPSDT